MVENVTGGVELPVDFEDSSLTYDITGFEGADSAVEANAVSGGINTSATVLRTIKTDGAQFFAGTFLNLDQAIDFTNSGSISIDTYSPKADIPVRLALENQDTGNQIFVDVNTTVADTWETLTFDFSSLISPTVDYNRVVVFFEFVDGLAGDGSTYYFDNVMVGESLSVDETEATIFSAFPNPSNNSWSINASEQITSIQLFDVLGKSILTVSGNANIVTVDGSSLNTGLYFAKVTTNSGSQTLRLVKK